MRHYSQNKNIRVFEKIIFTSRWALAIPYTGLTLMLMVFVFRFVLDFWQFLGVALSGKEDLLVETFHVLENVMICSFIVIIMLGGYATFLQKPSGRWSLAWLQTMSTYKLEVKLILSLLSFSSVKLLEIATLTDDPMVKIYIQLSFIASAIAVALVSKLILHDPSCSDASSAEAEDR
jgi:uncharacterized protein (TIGR00645 family)